LTFKKFRVGLIRMLRLDNLFDAMQILRAEGRTPGFLYERYPGQYCGSDLENPTDRGIRLEAERKLEKARKITQEKASSPHPSVERGK
jgi:hypothetical protein